MFILKKLNREKRVMTAADAAVLQKEGWKIVQEVKSKMEVDIEGVAQSISQKVAGQLNEMAKKSWEKPELEQNETNPEPEVAPEADTESEPEVAPEADTESESEVASEADTASEPEEQPEKKTTSKTRKKE